MKAVIKTKWNYTASKFPLKNFLVHSLPVFVANVASVPLVTKKIVPQILFCKTKVEKYHFFFEGIQTKCNSICVK